jgi:phosphoglucosamine mutase
LDGSACIFGQNFSQVPCSLRENIGKVFDYSCAVDRYISYLVSLGVNCNSLKIGLDCANGSASFIALKVFEKLGATVKVINAQPNGVNINDNAGSTHIEAIVKFVAENNLDLGFAYDGDADRCLCVDENGNVVTGDHILYICGKYLKKCGKLANNIVVATVMSNMGLFKALDKINIKYYKTDVGDKYVSEYIKKAKASLGGEASGHIIFSHYASTGDGILTSLKVIEVMLAENKKLSQLSCGLHLYPQVMLNVKVYDKDAVMQDSDVLLAVEKEKKLLGTDGRVLVRKSGTEPLIRVMVEAEDVDVCRSIAENIVKIIKDKGYAE